MPLQQRASGELLLTSSGQLADECCCGGGPPPVSNCEWSVSPTSFTFDCNAQAGSFNVNVPIGDDCGWSASVTSGGAFLSITSGGAGNTSSSVGISLLDNAGGDRSGTITVVTTIVSNLGPIGSVIGTVSVDQIACNSGASAGGGGGEGDCFWTLSPAGSTFDCYNQNGFFNVNTQPGCDWSASVISGGSYITIFSGASGTDSGTVQFSIDLNPGDARAGQILVTTSVISNLGPIGSTIGVFNIAQQSCIESDLPPCNWGAQDDYTVEDPCVLDTHSAVVTAGFGCGWEANVTVGGAWITITSGATGLATGPVTYEIAINNTGAFRNGEIVITTTVVSVHGPIGYVIGYFHIHQETCGACSVFPQANATYFIEGYADGLINNCGPGSLDTYGGVVTNWDSSMRWNGAYWDSGAYAVPENIVFGPSRDAMHVLDGGVYRGGAFLNCGAGTWILQVFGVKSSVSVLQWQGEKLTGGSPAGVYIRTPGAPGGCNSTLATLTVF